MLTQNNCRDGCERVSQVQIAAREDGRPYITAYRMPSVAKRAETTVNDEEV